jgi:hypothetical protein
VNIYHSFIATWIGRSARPCPTWAMAYETTMSRDTVSLPTYPNKPARKHDTVDQNSGQPAPSFPPPSLRSLMVRLPGVSAQQGHAVPAGGMGLVLLQNCFGIQVEVLGRTLPKARLILLSEIIKTCLLNLVVEEILARAPSSCASLQEPVELFGDLGTKLGV